MALVHIDRNPPEKLLRQFSALLPLFGLIIGFGLVHKFDLWAVARAIVALFVALGIAGWFSPKTIRPVWVGWMIVVYPIHWIVSHTLLFLVFYLVLAPIGLAMRAVGRDPLVRRWEPRAKSYWQPHAPPSKSSRYFRQF